MPTSPSRFAGPSLSPLTGEEGVLETWVTECAVERSDKRAIVIVSPDSPARRGAQGQVTEIPGFLLSRRFRGNDGYKNERAKFRNRITGSSAGMTREYHVAARAPPAANG
jgi:hypothetical protein